MIHHLITKATALAQWKCIKCNSNPTIISQEPSSNISIETINNPQQKLAKTTIKSDDRIAEYPIGVGDFVFLIGSQFTHLCRDPTATPIGKISLRVKSTCNIDYCGQLIKVNIDDCKPAILVSEIDIR